MAALDRGLTIFEVLGYCRRRRFVEEPHSIRVGPFCERPWLVLCSPVLREASNSEHSARLSRQLLIPGKMKLLDSDELEEELEGIH